MQVPSTTATSNAASGPVGAAKTATVDYNQFLQLLIAQLKNQDPTKPMDSAQFISQLASFSNVEQSIQTNAKLDALMTSSALSQAEGMIGRQITSADGETSGTIAAVRIVSGGAVALLENGSEIVLEAGVTLF
ncbi:MAG TPA: flagellar hook assembly protein FlgD [Hyphomicrobiaceae bacterium]|jgi:flagellar basal-body rod modification protein FlgD|nr:flagellar hook assembly protein FlgD [Hyphomicrobiaceae bacterium]